MFFVANDGVNGRELWRTNGTSAGTVLDMDIRSGATGSIPVKLTNVAGRVFFAADNGTAGSELWSSDGSVSIARNVISGNNSDGIQIGTGATGNVVLGNILGLNATGTGTIGNSISGVHVNAANGNTIGGVEVGAGNILSGNSSGIVIDGASANFVLGNLIGTDPSGTIDLGNTNNGITIQRSPNNTIGGSVAGARNIISGNNSNGIFIQNAGTASSGNIIQGNYIGTNVSGTAALANSSNGISISGGVSDSTIGGADSAARNLISGNAGAGIAMGTTGIAGTNNNVVQGNYIGTDQTGMNALPNALGGMDLREVVNSTIGGTTLGAGNLVSGNTGWGIAFSGASTGNVVQGNLIGPKVTGTAALANTTGGIEFVGTSSNNLLGGGSAAARNVISGNVQGVLLNGGSANTVKGNYIGLDINGTNALGNSSSGLTIIGTGLTGTNHIIGGSAAGEGNIISANGSGGITNTGADNTQILGNYIGLDATGTVARGNIGTGIQITSGSDNVLIGGTTAGGRNVISGNTTDGILVTSSAGAGTVISGNYIGTNAAGTAGIGNVNGVHISASGVTVGGTAAGAGNLISGNGLPSAGQGIFIDGGSGAIIQGNLIGTSAVGSTAIGNYKGVVVNGVANTQIGGSTAGARNVIAGNTGVGVQIVNSGATGTLLQGNYIGTALDGTTALANSGGIEIASAASNTTVGGLAAGAGNVIAFNTSAGVSIPTSAGTGNAIQGNSIRSNGGLGIDLVRPASPPTTPAMRTPARTICRTFRCSPARLPAPGSSAGH